MKKKTNPIATADETCYTMCVFGTLGLEPTTTTERCKTMIKATPSQEFLDELNKLTENNDHGKVYERIAEWCQSESMAVKEAYEEFQLFRKLLHTMNQFHKRMGYFNHGYLRYEVAQRMREACARVFGKMVAAQIDAAC